mmetsp:Transcript_73714/g.221618  ORF Transcript_73714/g.221618 Transcript_73714/m.221618 type:complete len:230 (+) Transcript_73714:826-1515(+)
MLAARLPAPTAALARLRQGVGQRRARHENNADGRRGDTRFVSMLQLVRPPKATSACTTCSRRGLRAKVRARRGGRRRAGWGRGPARPADGARVALGVLQRVASLDLAFGVVPSDLLRQRFQQATETHVRLRSRHRRLQQPGERRGGCAYLRAKCDCAAAVLATVPGVRFAVPAVPVATCAWASNDPAAGVRAHGPRKCRYRCRRVRVSPARGPPRHRRHRGPPRHPVVP